MGAIGGTTDGPERRMTLDQFMRWQQDRAGRYELYGGRAVRMQAERNIHSIVKANVRDAFAVRLREAGVDCMALADGPTVAIDEAHGFVPDASVQCGPIDLDSVYNEDPVVVVEVISPGSRAVDEVKKFRHYFRNSRVHHYLIVDPDDRSVIHYWRAGDKVETAIGARAVLELDPPGFTIETASFFEGLGGGD